MSATARVAAIPKRAVKKLAIDRRPSAEARYRLRECAKQLLYEGYSYREAQDLLRLYLMDTALMDAAQVKTKAAKRLKISRDHVRDFHRRGKGLL
jgi:transposase